MRPISGSAVRGCGGMGVRLRSWGGAGLEEQARVRRVGIGGKYGKVRETESE